MLYTETDHDEHVPNQPCTATETMYGLHMTRHNNEMLKIATGQGIRKEENAIRTG